MANKHAPQAAHLTAQQLLFVEHYLELRNAKAAARAAGYSDNGKGSIDKTSYALMQRPAVKAAIADHDRVLRTQR